MPMLSRLRSALPLPLALALSGCPGDDGESSTTDPNTTGQTAPELTDDGTTAEPPLTTTSVDESGSESTSEAEGTTTAGGSSQVVMETTLGAIVIELDPALAPITTTNFLAYVDAGFYDGSDGLGATIVHRVVPGFVVQGGGLTEDLSVKATMPPIVNEFGNGLLNVRGSLSMARLPEPDTATSQFFINLVDNPDLDTPPGYAVFGQVVQGMEVVDAMAMVPTTSMGPYDGVPVDPIVITSVSVQ